MFITMSPTAHAALTDAMCKRGPRKGLLLANAPPASSLAYAAWQAAMLNVNPYKVSIAGVMFFSDEQREVYREVTDTWNALAPHVKAALRNGLDKDASALRKLGVW